MLLLLATSSFFGMPCSALLPVLAKDVLRGDARLLGALSASAGGGALLAAPSGEVAP